MADMIGDARVDLRSIDADEEERWRAAMDKAGYSIDSVADNEPCLVEERDWESYTREVFEETSQHANLLDQWPFNCIDWEDAARELDHDYSEFDVTDDDGTTFTYKFRSF